MEVFSDIPTSCSCGYGTGHCDCGERERVLRRYINGDNIRPMTAEERAWSIEEASRCGDGYFRRDELTARSDKDLADAVMVAWQMYALSNCM